MNTESWLVYAEIFYEEEYGEEHNETINISICESFDLAEDIKNKASLMIEENWKEFKDNKSKHLDERNYIECENDDCDYCYVMDMVKYEIHIKHFINNVMDLEFLYFIGEGNENG